MNYSFCSSLPDLNSYYNSTENTVDVLLDCVHCGLLQSRVGLGAIGVKRIAINDVSVTILFYEIVLRITVSSVDSKKLTTSSYISKLLSETRAIHVHMLVHTQNIQQVRKIANANVLFFPPKSII